MNKTAWVTGMLALAGLAGAATLDQDPILQAMQDELARAKQLKIVDLDAPYYIEYRVEDATALTVEASLGALIVSNETTLRIPTVRMRVGDYKFDNANHIYSEYYGGTRFDPEHLPLENNYQAIREALWLSTDRVYKTAEEAIARKRSSIKNINLTAQLPDYSKAEPLKSIAPVHKTPFNEAQWRDKIVKLSAIFADYPEVIQSGIEMQAVQSNDYMVTSEGTTLRYPENLAFIRVRAYAQAPDGSPVREAQVFQSFEVSGLPVEAELRRGIEKVAQEVTALAKAPVGETYDGPVLFEPMASAEIFGQLLGENLKITRKPISDGNRTAPYMASEFENRMGSRVLPEWMDVVDDPTQTEWRGQNLFGFYQYDLEGLSPKPLTLVEKGVLKSLLLTRTPVMKGFETSNARARMPGSYEERWPGYGNLFIRAAQSSPEADLKKKLIELSQQRNKPYGLLVRSVDFPSSATIDELRKYATLASQNGAGGQPVALPQLVYRVYPDGREELVRGLRFRGMTAKSFKDILAASSETAVLNLLDNPAPFALMGAGGFTTNAAVIAPGVLFDELELEPLQLDTPKAPIVPPPPLTQGHAARTSSN